MFRKTYSEAEELLYKPENLALLTSDAEILSRPEEAVKENVEYI